jgi:hypothetical protein
MDWSDGPLKIMPWWNARRTGPRRRDEGDGGQGRIPLDAAVKECVEFVGELLEKALPVR